jgi:alpha-L-rhamnosidase
MTTVPYRLRTDGRTEPMGVGSPFPEFSWRVDAAQSGYELEVATAPTFDASTLVWRSGEVASARPFGVRYAGAGLTTATRYHWRVRVTTDFGVTEWSAASTFETGLLNATDWAFPWIAEPPREKGRAPRTQYFRGVADLPGGVVRARAYASALGWYRLFVNGLDQTGHALVPRYTDFDQAVEYQVYDVTDALMEGTNVLGVVVAEGRYRGALGTFSRTERYGDRLATIVQLEVELADGSTRRFGTDPTWSVGSGPILTADPKFGERIDFRIPEVVWTTDPAFVTKAHALPAHPRVLIAEDVERVTAVATRTATISRTPSGAQLLDFGQNINGVARLRLQAAEGTTVVIRYSEVLTPEGELDMDYLEYASSDDWFQRDEVVLGAEPVDYTPSFTIRGFRFVTVEGGRELTSADASGIELSTPLEVRSEFRASDPRLEQMNATTMASLRANFADTATDCPTRERTGWTGDVQIFAPTAAILVDVQTFLRRYLRNLALEQDPDGRVPNWIPSETSDFSWGLRDRLLMFVRSSVGWGDAAVLVPWTLYEYFGDEETLRRQYPTARAWVEQLERRAMRSGLARRFGPRVGKLERFIIDTGYHYGEWLRPGETPASTFSANTRRPPAEIATAYFALSSRVLGLSAAVLGDVVEAERWGEVSERVREAWRAAFVTNGGSRIALDRQDDYVRALEFDLLLPEQRQPAADRLAELVAEAGDHLATGFLSTPLLLQALSNNGHADVAYRVLLQETSPSWLNQLSRGATTWWETWEGYEDNGRAKVSHNHYAFGSVSRWLYEHVAGLRPLEPAYRRFVVAPQIGGGLESASASIDTPYGIARSSWRRVGRAVHLDVAVPHGTTVEIRTPHGVHVVGPGEHSVTWPVTREPTGAE